MKQKYNWKALKNEYFKSKFDEVEGFIQDKYKTKTNWYIRQNTKGRKEEKEKYREEIYAEAKERNKEKAIQDLEIPIEIMKEWKKEWILSIVEDLKAKKLSMSDKVKGINQLKVELWEPTSFTKNDTTLRGDPLDESLFIED